MPCAVDREDNVWAVDEGTNIILKYRPGGKLLMVLGKRPDPIDQLEMMPGVAPYSGANRTVSGHAGFAACPPTDVPPRATISGVPGEPGAGASLDSHLTG
jgi:hypothetical protein